MTAIIRASAPDGGHPIPEHLTGTRAALFHLWTHSVPSPAFQTAPHNAERAAAPARGTPVAAASGPFTLPLCNLVAAGHGPGGDSLAGRPPAQGAQVREFRLTTDEFIFAWEAEPRRA